MTAPIQTDRINLAQRVGGQINIAAALSIITDSMVSANSAALSTLKSAIATEGLLGGPHRNIIALKTIDAINVGKDLSLWSENYALSSISTLVSATGVDLTRRIGIWS